MVELSEEPGDEGVAQETGYLPVDSPESCLCVVVDGVLDPQELPVDQDLEEVGPADQDSDDQVDAQVDLQVVFKLQQLSLVLDSLLNVVLKVFDGEAIRIGI